MGTVYDQILNKLEELHSDVRSNSRRLSIIIGSQDTMSTTLADLDAALAQEDASLASLGNALATVSADITTLISKVEAGAPIDLTAELQKVQSHIGTIQTAQNSLVADDAAANPTSATASGTASGVATGGAASSAAGSGSTSPTGVSTSGTGAAPTGGAEASPATSAAGTSSS